MLDRFLSSDVNVIAPNYSKHIPPSFLFPFSPSFVNDLNEFTFQYQHHHQDLIPQPHPFLDSSSDTIAESHQTKYMPVSSGILGMATNNKTSTTTNSSVDPSSTTTSSIRKIITQQQETSTTPRKRSAKKDRHSKIVTAQGPRDRRMRLSFDIARRFFTLQDMLGFDKASKTVEWLLTKSRSAIKELSSSGFSHDRTKASTAGSSTSSECEVISVVDNEEDQDQVMKCSSEQGPATRNKEKRTRQTRKATFHPLARESRIKARARARERTMERSLRSSRSSIQLTCMRSSSSDHQQPFEEESSHSYDVKSNNSLEAITVAHEVEKPQSSDQTSIIDNIIKKSFVNTRELSGQSSSIFGYSNRSFPGFDESWELHNHPISTGEVLENCPTSYSSSFSFVPNFDTRLQSQFADHSTRF